jgi:hypothetical protein
MSYTCVSCFVREEEQLLITGWTMESVHEEGSRMTLERATDTPPVMRAILDKDLCEDNRGFFEQVAKITSKYWLFPNFTRRETESCALLLLLPI